MINIKYFEKAQADNMKIKMFLQKFLHLIVTIKDGNDPDQCRRLTLFDAFQVVVNDKNVLFFNLINSLITLSNIGSHRLWPRK